MMRRRTQAVYVISVAAELAGMHPQTLRIYERRGLVQPARTQGGNRRYSDADIEVLRRISELAESGMNLEGIRRVMELEAENDRLRAELAAARARRRAGRHEGPRGGASWSRSSRRWPCSASARRSCASATTNPTTERRAQCGDRRGLRVVDRAGDGVAEPVGHRRPAGVGLARPHRRPGQLLRLVEPLRPARARAGQADGAGDGDERGGRTRPRRCGSCPCGT